jgi:addiction module HigA family antidote
MSLAVHPGRLLKRELDARNLSANRLALDLGVPSGRITDILNGRRSITADTAVRLSRILETAHNFGSICRANTTLPSSSESTELKSQGGSDPGMQPDTLRRKNVKFDANGRMRTGASRTLRNYALCIGRRIALCQWGRVCRRPLGRFRAAVRGGGSGRWFGRRLRQRAAWRRGEPPRRRQRYVIRRRRG